jgi:hypothetical protein
MTIMNGKLSHPFVAKTVKKEVDRRVEPGTGSIPSIWTTWFTTPNCWWNMPRQMRAVM